MILNYELLIFLCVRCKFSVSLWLNKPGRRDIRCQTLDFNFEERRKTIQLTS